MSSFKHKANKLKYLSNIQTLDELHHNYLAKIDEKKNNIPQKKYKLEELIKQIENLELHSTNDIKLKSNIKCEIKILQEEIQNAEGNNDVLEYISKTGDLLVNYYNITSNIYNNLKENININETEIQNNNNNNNIDENEENSGIYISDKLKYLNQLSQKTRKIKKPVKKRRIIQEIQTGNSILNFLHVKSNEKLDDIQISINKATLQDKYLMLIDKNYACDRVKTNKIIYCTQCKIEKTLFQSEGCYICKNCGETEHIIMESEVPSHKELSNEKQKYPYKKINHLKEKLNQFQSKESADVPDEICDIIRGDLIKRRILYENCTPPDIRSILKKHRLTSYYEHLQQIYCKISGDSPITLSRETEEKIINMFQTMQESFHIHCPCDRSNFLSYSYVLNKLFKILDMKEHSKYFGLLKSKDKLREQDIIWNKICKDIGWKFYSSF